MGNKASKIFKVLEDPLPVDPVEIPDEPTQEPSKEPTGPPPPPVAYIDCGSASQGHESNDVVSVSENTFVARVPLAEIESDVSDFSSFGTTQRWAENDFTYTIQVPVPGEYDVTLVFAETYDGAFGVGKRIFNAVIRGTKAFTYDNIDVFEQVGANKVFTIAVQNVPAEYSIKIDLQKGAIQNPFICGIVVGAVENPSEPVGRPPIPSPTNTVTQEQYDDCIQKIDAYIEAAKANAPSEVREVPQYLFHAPGTPVRGLIMTFHGFSGRHYDSRILARVSSLPFSSSFLFKSSVLTFFPLILRLLCSIYMIKATMSSTQCSPAICTPATTGRRRSYPKSTAAPLSAKPSFRTLSSPVFSHSRSKTQHSSPAFSASCARRTPTSSA